MSRTATWALRSLSAVWLIVLLLAGCASAAATPTTDQATFAAANALYEAGSYREAVALYEQLLAQGYADAALYYNLGNAYYRSADWGRAIVNYQRAQLLAPRDAAIRANLARARTQTTDRLSAQSDEPLLALAQLGDRLTLNELNGLALGVWLMIVAGLAVYQSPQRFLRSDRQRTALQSTLVILGVLLAILLLLLGSRLIERRLRPAVVVVAAETAVRPEPRTQAAGSFTLHSGAEISLVQRRGRWVEVALPGAELTGWLPAADIEPVVPLAEQGTP